MNKSPAFQWYPKDILSSERVQVMSLEEEGAYRRLLDYCWLGGSIPADPGKCARLIGKGATVEIATVALGMFIPDPNDPQRMIHDRLEIEREKQEKNSEARRSASEARWGKQGTVGKQADSKANTDSMQTESKPDANAMQMESLSSAVSSSSASASANLQTAAARAEFPDDPPDEPAAAQTAEINKISNQLAKLYGLKTSGGWKLQGQFQTAAIELHSQEATAEQIEAFWHWRQKKPDIKYFAGDFLTWRASQNGKTAQANLREDLAERARQGLETLKQEDERRARRRLSAIS